MIKSILEFILVHSNALRRVIDLVCDFFTNRHEGGKRDGVLRKVVGDVSLHPQERRAILDIR